MSKIGTFIIAASILILAGVEYFHEPNFMHSHPAPNPVLIGFQHMTCDGLSTIDNIKVSELPTPKQFSISPAKAVQLASDLGEFKCGHKLGAAIYVGERYYYLVRLAGWRELNLQHDLSAVSIAINGNSGNVLEIRSHRNDV